MWYNYQFCRKAVLIQNTLMKDCSSALQVPCLVLPHNPPFPHPPSIKGGKFTYYINKFVATMINCLIASALQETMYRF